MKYYIQPFSDPDLGTLQTTVQAFLDTIQGAVIISDTILWNGTEYVLTLVYKK